jgi:hypothetical protein
VNDRDVPRASSTPASDGLFTDNLKVFAERFPQCLGRLTVSAVPHARTRLRRSGRSRTCGRRFSSPWPMMRMPQCSHAGASLWMAHSKLSNV